MASGPLHGPCWEAMLALAVRDNMPSGDETRPSEFRIRRSFGPKRLRLAPLRRLNNTEGGRMLHLIGSLQETIAGLRFQEAQDHSYRIQGEQAQAELVSKTNNQLLLSPAELQVRYPSLQLCIIQGDPATFSEVRTDSDRRAAALVRVFVHELRVQMSATGARTPIVIIIPPLPPRLAVQATIVVVQELRGFLPRWWVPQRIVAKIQDLIFDSLSAPSEANVDRERLWETALDVCLYV